MACAKKKSPPVKRISQKSPASSARSESTHAETEAALTARTSGQGVQSPSKAPQDCDVSLADKKSNALRIAYTFIDNIQQLPSQQRMVKYVWDQFVEVLGEQPPTDPACIEFAGSYYWDMHHAVGYTLNIREFKKANLPVPRKWQQKAERARINVMSKKQVTKKPTDGKSADAKKPRKSAAPKDGPVSASRWLWEKVATNNEAKLTDVQIWEQFSKAYPGKVDAYRGGIAWRRELINSNNERVPDFIAKPKAKLICFGEIPRANAATSDGGRKTKAAKKAAPAKKATPAKKAAPAKKATPAKKTAPAKKATPSPKKKSPPKKNDSEPAATATDAQLDKLPE